MSLSDIKCYVSDVSNKNYCTTLLNEHIKSIWE